MTRAIVAILGFAMIVLPAATARGDGVYGEISAGVTVDDDVHDYLHWSMGAQIRLHRRGAIRLGVVVDILGGRHDGFGPGLELEGQVQLSRRWRVGLRAGYVRARDEPSRGPVVGLRIRPDVAVLGLDALLSDERAVLVHVGLAERPGRIFAVASSWLAAMVTVLSFAAKR